MDTAPTDSDKKESLRNEVCKLRMEIEANPKGDHRQRRDTVLLACGGLQTVLTSKEVDDIRELGFDKGKTLDQLYAEALARSLFK
jgi:hypothetical protein